jgi:hypothetical protein
MNSLSSKAALFGVVIVMCGCTATPVLSGVPAQPGADTTQDQRAQIRDAQKVISYFNKINPALVRQDKGAADKVPRLAPIRLTIKDALAKFVPAEYQVTLTKDVNSQTVIVYDPSLPWIEALGKGLAGASLEMNANLYKRAMLVKHFETSLADVIEKHVPGEYKVFTDAEISVDSMIRYDERQHWADALSESGQQSGLDITANLTRKLIVIKPLVTNNKDEIKKP